MDTTKQGLEDLRIDRSAGARRRGWTGWIVTLVIVAIIILVVWRMKSGRAIPVHVAVAHVQSANDRIVLNASGYVTARREATVSSKVTGKVTEVLVEEGMQVKEGQVLARLDDTNIKAGLRLAEAQLEAAKAALAETAARQKEADTNFRRISELSKQNVSTAAELDHAEAEAASLKAKLEQQQTEITVAERQVATWQQQLDDTVIRAPFSGMVTSKNAQPGEMISPISAGGGFTRTGICTIVDMNSLEIEVDVSESYIDRVQPRQPVEATLDAYPEWKIPGKVIAIIPTADRQKATIKVRIGLEKTDPKILPEMSIKVGFREEASKNQPARHVSVPNAAVQHQNGQDFVWLLANGRAQRRTVKLGATAENEIEVSDGLKEGDSVIVDAPAGLKDGERVRTAEVQRQ